MLCRKFCHGICTTTLILYDPTTSLRSFHRHSTSAFYGNKLFQSTFLLALTGEDATLTHISGAAAINAFVALLGYYAAALIVDNPIVGRLRLQQTGFIITGTLFLICGFLSEHLSSTTLVVIYLGSSFFGQCGPNCTTFLIPAEVFPTE